MYYIKPAKYLFLWLPPDIIFQSCWPGTRVKQD